MQLAFLFGAFSASLLGSVHCAGMCGGFALAAHARGGGAAWHVGRLATYVGLGLGAGAIGALLPLPPLLWNALTLGVFAWFCARLAGLGGAALHVPLPRLARAAATFARTPGPLAQAAFGALTGLLPCGLLYATVSLAAAARSPVESAAIMLAFWAGTLPSLLMAGALLRRLAAAKPSIRRWVAAALFLVGAGAFALRGGVHFTPSQEPCPLPGDPHGLLPPADPP